jgi:hypothetical protein
MELAVMTFANSIRSVRTRLDNTGAPVFLTQIKAHNESQELSQKSNRHSVFHRHAFRWNPACAFFDYSCCFGK